MKVKLSIFAWGLIFVDENYLKLILCAKPIVKVFLLVICHLRIAEADNTAKYWPNLGSQQSATVIRPVSPFAKTWLSIGPIPSRLSLLLWHLVPKVEEPEFDPSTAYYWAMCHFYHGKPFWKWENQSSAQHRPVAVSKTSFVGQR